MIYDLAKKIGYATEPKGGDDKIVRLQQGQKAAKTLSGAKATKEGEITLERLAELDGEEFDKMWIELQKRGAL